MGFSGQFVFGCSDQSLLEAGAFDGVRPPWGDGVHELWPRPGGWQTLQFRDERWGLEELRALVEWSGVEWSGAPACFAMVHDSEVAHVVGLAPDGREWQAVLGLAIAAEMGIGRPRNVHDDLDWVDSPNYAEAVSTGRAALEAAVSASAEAAIAWAAAAGVVTAAEQGAVEAVLRSQEVFVEDLFTGLLGAPGFPAAIESVDDAEVQAARRATGSPLVWPRGKR